MASYKRIRDLREDSDMTQTQLADLLFINRRTYSSYELGVNGTPPDVLSNLADLFHTSVDYLMERTDVKTPYPKPLQPDCPHRFIDVTGLTDEQIKHIQNFVDDLKKLDQSNHK